jgi:curved DNA-binding protein CbpA
VSVPDPYKVLQVDPEAEPEVIEAAYRRLARKYHPDVSPGAESQERMVRLNQAWEMLRDPTRRAAVDRARARAQAAAATVAASEARTQAAGDRWPEPTGQGTRAGARAAPRSTSSSSWPPGVVDPNDPQTGPAPQATSPHWTPGRSTTGSRYDASTMHPAEAAGPPPGNPSGTVLNFGRYAGWSLGEIGRTDLEYLEWLDRMPIGRAYQAEIDALLRARGRRVTARPESSAPRGLFRRP